ncbi:MAG: alanine--tRNA ligase [Desulfitibacter sp. BRH_c19]|nr:MAG: alanine--tRNA ligase [Desulfitibacter sp. BRH_c19]
MQGKELREAFLNYFANRGHRIVESSSLVPHNDPTLLFTNAGMVQFKDLFTAMEKRNYKRAVTAQKCVRAGGKHNDLDTVGRTARHHTFFEMMGNFSFGDYFKKEAIEYAWEFLTSELKLPKERLWVTIYLDDDEAYELWLQNTDVSEDRIVRLGEKDNFWAMGDTGPCGPCSEIIYDRGAEHSCESSECALGACDCDRWLEIWNLVFMQFERDADGDLTPLPRPSIDTGMGLERVASILQEVNSNYDTDLMKPLLHWVEKHTGKQYSPGEEGFPFRVIADHARSCTFLIADGVLPGNEGRAYVLRRILRRAVRLGKVIGIDNPFLNKMVVEVGKLMGGAYPQIIEKQEHIQKIIKLEEKKFHETINEGMKMANDIVATVKKEGKTHIPGHEAFVLYDTFGFPLDLTKDLAEENGIDVDTEGFQREMEEQRQRARAARDDAKGWDFSATFIGALGEIGKTTFIGYGQTSNETKLLSIIIGDKSVETASNGDDVFVLLKETPFYPEGGGQIGDQGEIANKNGRIEIIDTKKLPDGKIIHIGRVVEGSMRAGSMVSVSVNSHRRLNTARNHTATHLLHQALMDVLGDHVNQAGSLVTPQRLRFDFNHFNAVTSKEITQVEDIVNRQLLFGNHLKFFETSLEEAKELGAAALFGEKYGEKVRVVQIGDYSLELCGGTHVNSTSEIGILKIISEGGIGSGLRRIEAITGPEALNYLNTMESITKEIGNTLKTDSEHIISKVEQLIYENKEKSREIEKLSTRLASYQSQNLLDSIIDIEGVKLLAVKVDARNMDALRNMGDTFRTKLQSGVVVLGASIEDKASFLVMATKDVVDRGVHAGNIIRDVAKIAGGGGGGRPDMAQAGGKDPSKIEEALNAAKSIIQGQIK